MQMEFDERWNEIYASRQSNKILTGILAAVEPYKLKDKETDCGVVFYDGVKVIIPLSEMGVPEDRRVIRSMAGAELDFIVRGIDTENGIAVASRKSAMELRKRLELHKHKVGDKILVRVTGIGKSWIYVEAYGVETKVEKEELAYGHVTNPSEYVQLGEKIEAIIKEINVENDHVVVSIKDATEDPFKFIENKYRNEGEYLAEITGVRPFGVFVKLEQGIYALCNHPNWVGYKPGLGDTVLIKIKKIEINSRKINATLVRSIRNKRVMYR